MRLRSWLLACAALLIVLSPIAAAGPVAAATGRAAPFTQRPGPPYQGMPVASDGALRQAYDLLLDNFVMPPDPSILVSRTASAIARQVAEAVPGEWPTPTLSAAASRDAAWDTFALWLDRVADLAGPAMDRATLDELAFRALAAAVQENHTRYLSPRQHDEHQAWRRGDVRYDGIGARLRRPSTVVLEVFDESPAARAGLRPGDRVVAIDGAPVGDGTTESAIGRLRGPSGTSVAVTVERRGEINPLVLVIHRDEIKLTFVSWRVLTPGDGQRIGYLRLRGFPDASIDDRVGEALDGLKSAGIDGLVLDVRGNGGGRLDIGLKVISRFVRDGVVFQQVDRGGRQRLARAGGSHWDLPVPMVTLVDGGTASMGEILSSALQEAGVSRIVGTRTSGSVAGARLFPLMNGGAVQITVLTIVSGRGTALNDVGVIPDEDIDMSDDQLLGGVDAQLEAGLRFLQTEAMSRRVGLRPALVPCGVAA